MKIRFLTLAAALFALTASSIATAASLTSCKEAMGNFKDLGNVSELLAQSYGYAVLPTIGKGGVGIGGAAGSGCVFADGKHTGDVSMGQLSIGWQLGGQAYSQLILFQNADTYKEFIQGNFEFGADATAVALTYGAAASATTQGASASAGDTAGKGGWKRGMAIFTLAKGGLMYEAVLAGQKYKFKPLGE
ncbi:MAG: YSC84-related protein [Xanthomonadales bacterium]